MENSTALGNKDTYKPGIKVFVCVLALFALEARNATYLRSVYEWSVLADPGGIQRGPGHGQILPKKTRDQILIK